MYTHLTKDDRAVIAAGLRAQRSSREIADEIGKDKSTVCRDVTRNGGRARYRAHTAHARARQKRKESKEGTRLSRTHPHLMETAETLLHPLISPEVIGYGLGIHHQSIYAWLYRERRDLLGHLPRRGKKRRRYGAKQSGWNGWRRHVRSISTRPEGTPSWEGDTVCGSTRARLLTHVERYSLYTRVDRLIDGSADTVQATLKHNPLVGIVTYDQGSEFALWRMIEEATDCEIYFAHAGCPHERAINENTNERIRRIYPKRTDFETIDRRELALVVDLINHTPRKSRDWRMPAEMYWCTSD